MKSLGSGIIVLASAGLLLLGGCGKETKTDDTASTSSAPSAETKPTTTDTKPMDGMEKSHMAPRKGGQVVESGKYHLELVPEKEGSGTHLDFYLFQGDKHEIMPNAKVTADIQSPDGKLKTVPFSYDASGKHYAAVVSEKAAGQYQVKITATVGSEQVDGRFKFDR
jgi:major membrane immunogen (membrane-anchored lipoprotein)